jgi:hypothetical protein
LMFLVLGIPYFQRTAVNPDRPDAQITVAVYYYSANPLNHREANSPHRRTVPATTLRTA